MESTQLTAIRRFLEHQLRDLADFEGQRYLDLRVSWPRGPATLEWAGDLGEEAEDLETTRFSARTSALLQPGQRSYLIGVSGAGKTVTLGSLALRLSRDAIAALASEESDQPVPLVPLWRTAMSVPGVDVARPLDLLAGILEEGGIYGDARALMATLMDTGKVVLFIDGLQEIPHGEPGRLRNLRKLLTLPGLTVLAASRPGYELPGVDERAGFLRLRGLDRADRQQLLELRGLKGDAVEALQRLALRRRLRRAVDVPQIWQMAIALHTEGEDLAGVTSPTMLYRRFVNVVIDRRAQRRQGRGEGPGYAPGELLPILEMLGAASVFRGGQPLPMEEAEALIAQWASATNASLNRDAGYDHRWCRELLDHLPRYYQPVLRASRERKEIGFVHGSLAEFLTARWMLRVRPTVPEELLPVPELASTLAFHFDLQEEACAEQAVVQGPGEAVVPFLHCENSHVRRSAVQALGTLQDSSTASTLRPLLHDPDDHVRSAAVKAVGQLCDRESLPVLRESLCSPNAYVTSAACIAVGVLGDRGDGERLAGLLEHSNRFVRGAALRGLGFLGAVEWARAVRRHLLPNIERDGINRGVAAKTAGFLQDAAAVPALRAMLRKDPNPYNKSAAADSLGLLGAIEAGAALQDLLHAQDPFNRACAARALCLIGDIEALPSLLQLLNPRHETGGVVRGSAATALGQLGDPRAVDPLIRSLSPEFEGDGVNRGSAATALGQLGDPRAVAPLIRSLDREEEPNEIVRQSVAVAISRLNSSAPPSAGERASERDPSSSLSEARTTVLDDLWPQFLREFFDHTAAPLVAPFDLHLERSLRVLEQMFGGGESRKWREKDYQRILAGLLSMGENFRVLTEAEPADRERLDIHVETTAAPLRQAILELKWHEPSKVRSAREQLRRDVKSLSASGATPIQPHLIFLDRRPQPQWSEAERHREDEGIHTWLVHVNRQPASSR